MSSNRLPSAPEMTESTATVAVHTTAAPGFSSPQEEALLTLFRTADALEHELQQRLKSYGITSPQYNVLRILRAATGSEGTKPQGLMCSAIGRLMITPEP